MSTPIITSPPKTCKKCGGIEFYYSNGKCIPCQKIANHEWRLRNTEKTKRDAHAYYVANSEKAKEYSKSYRLANPEKVKSFKAAWHIANREKRSIDYAQYRIKNRVTLREKKVAWVQSNSDHVKAYHSEWLKKNKDVGRGYSQNRRSRKTNNGGTLSLDLTVKLFKLQRGKCACCGLPLGDNYHLDHIMPLYLGGPNIDNNMQLLRKHCNLKKHAKHPVDFMQERGF